MASSSNVNEPPRKRRKVAVKKQLETVAPQASLELLPDNILLTVMSLLDVRSIIFLSRVCRRFYHLYTDESVWSEVDLTTLSSKLDVRKLKKIIRDRLPPSMGSVRLSSPRRGTIITTPVLDDLFTKCTHIHTIRIENSDLTALTKYPGCKLFQSTSLEHISLVSCSLTYQWMQKVQLAWPRLTHLSLSHSVKTSDDDMKFIAGCKELATSLRCLRLNSCYRLSNMGMKVLSESLRNLRTLDISNCNGITHNSLEYIAKIKSLKHLCIVKMPLTNDVYMNFPEQFPNLKTLFLSVCSDDVDLAPLMPNTRVVTCSSSDVPFIVV